MKLCAYHKVLGFSFIASLALGFYTEIGIHSPVEPGTVFTLVTIFSFLFLTSTVMLVLICKKQQPELFETKGEEVKS